MTNVQRLFSAALVVLATAAPATAQPPVSSPRKPERAQGSVGFLVGAPVGGFGSNVDSAGGLSGHFDVGLGPGILSVGGEVSYLSYGSESREMDLGALIPELPGATATLTTDNAMVLVHGRIRAQRRQGRWRPYVDGLYGFNYIYTRSFIEESTCSGSDCYGGIEATNLSDFVPSFGVAAGVIVDVGRPGGVRLDASVCYLRGGEAAYLTEGAIRREGGRAVLDISRSRTDMILVYFGINFGR